MKRRFAGAAGAKARTAESVRRRPSWVERFGPLIVGASAFLAFIGGVTNGFSYDDPMVITKAEPMYRQPSLWPGLLTPAYFNLSHESTFRPLVTFSYLFDYSISEFQPWAYHLQSIAWHILAAILVFLLARRLLPEKARVLAICAGLFFAIHPVLSEAVDNVSFREDLQATALVTAALLLALRETFWSRCGALVCYALALFAKESAIVAPVLLVGARLYDPASSKERKGRLLRDAYGFLPITLVYLLIRFGPMKGSDSYAEYPGDSLWVALSSMPRVFAHYLRLVFVPWPLCADYPGVIKFTRLTPSFANLSALAVLAGFVTGLVLLIRRRPLAAFGLAWFAVALGPVSNLIPIPVPVAERFLYLPMVGIALAVADGVAFLNERLSFRARSALLWVGASWAAALVLLTNSRHPAWRDNITLWRTTVTDFPSAWGAHHGLGTEIGESNTPEGLAEAAREMNIALETVDSTSARARIENDLGVVYGKQQRLDDSERVLRASIQHSPLSNTYLNLGVTLMQRGDLDTAAKLMEEATKRDPLYARGYAMLGVIKLQKRDLDGARALIEKAKKISPHDPGVQGAEQQLNAAMKGAGG